MSAYKLYSSASMCQMQARARECEYGRGVENGFPNTFTIST